VQDLADPSLASGLREPHGATTLTIESNCGSATGGARRRTGGSHLGLGVGEQSDEVGGDVGLGELESSPLAATMFSLRPERINDANDGMPIREQAECQR
jgi:hypothetical protein